MATNPEIKLQAQQLTDVRVFGRRAKVHALFQPLTVEQLKTLSGGDRVLLGVGNDKSHPEQVRGVKVTSVKTWKRDTSRVRIGWKYGMYEFGTVEVTGEQTSRVFICEEVK
jgi:hypothetical protein